MYENIYINWLAAILLNLLWWNHNDLLVDQPLNLIIFVEDLHVVVFQPQISISQPGNTEEGKRIHYSLKEGIHVHYALLPIWYNTKEG